LDYSRCSLCNEGSSTLLTRKRTQGNRLSTRADPGATSTTAIVSSYTSVFSGSFKMNNMEMASGKHLITLEHRWLEFFWFITLELLLQI
jgi:hypothetical protein